MNHSHSHFHTDPHFLIHAKYDPVNVRNLLLLSCLSPLTKSSHWGLCKGG
jgi:hypothetical protein